MSERSTGLRIAFWLGLLVAGWALAILLAAPAHDLLTTLGWSRPMGQAKVLRRLLLVPPVLVFLFALRPWRDGTLADYGLVGPNARWRPALLAAAATLLILGAMVAWHIAEGWLVAEPGARAGAVARRISWRLVGAFVGAVLEEWLFRGWAYRRLARIMRPLAAVGVVAAVFALLHAFKPAAIDLPEGAGVAATFQAVGTWLGRLVDPAAFGPSFVGLSLLSVLLSSAYLRTRTLWTPIAIHAAAVWFLHSYGALTERTAERTFAGTKWIHDGWPAWIALALAAALLWPRRSAEAVRSKG